MKCCREPSAVIFDDNMEPKVVKTLKESGTGKKLLDTQELTG